MYTPTATRTEFRRFSDGTETYVEVEKRIDMIEAIVRTRVYRGVPELEVTNCFCCSCDDTGDGFIQSDAACRNHGFAAARPCELHGMPGQPWGDELGEDHPEYGKMPESVQVKRAADRKRYDDWEAKNRG